MKTSRTARAALALFAAIGLLAATGGCDQIDRASQYNEPGNTPPAGRGPAAELRLGYFPNITHAAALVAVQKGYVAAELGIDTKLTTQTFNDGTEAVAALLGNSLDIAFIGPGPAINAFTRSNGEAVRLIAGAATGGVQLVAKPGIDSAEQLKGKKVATPKLGNTQDIALKKWLADRDVETGSGPDQVAVVNTDNPLILDAFRAGDLDAAWLPEPWASRLVLDAGATVLLDEKELWPNGEYPTTVVLARTEFVRDYPESVQALLRAELAAIDWATANAGEAREVVNTALEQATGRTLAEPVIERAFGNVTLTADPLAAQFPQLAKDAVTAGVARTAPDLAGFVDLGPLNTVLAAAGKPTVDAAGLDNK